MSPSSLVTPTLAAGLPDTEHRRMGDAPNPPGMRRGPERGRDRGLTWWLSSRH